MRLRFFSMGGGEEIGITIVKMGVQPVLEPNGTYNRNIVINLRCEWTLRAHSHWSTKIVMWRTSEKKIIKYWNAITDFESELG